MSVYSIDNFMPVVEEGDTLDIWNADYVGISDIPVSAVVLVTSEWAANLPGLAALHLGSRYLWWVLLAYNGLYDAVRDVYVGSTLKIPDRDALMTYIEGRKAARLSGNRSSNRTADITLL
jgi:hypothetical protein